MAYEFDVTESTKQVAEGRVSTTYRIRERDIDPAVTASQWTLPIPDQATVTLLTADLLAGLAATIQPELGYVSEWTTGGVGHIDQAASAAANHRIAQLKLIDTHGGFVLYGRSVPNVATGTGVGWHVTTFVTITAGLVA